MRICFVCLGNICRSPTAEGVFRHVVARDGVEGRYAIDSAGTSATHAGERADPRARAAASRRGIELSSRSRQFVAADFEDFDLVLAMDGSNAADLRRIAPSPEAAQKVRLFRSYDPMARGQEDLPDPYYGGDDGFELVLDVCERTCVELVRRTAP